MPTQIEKKKKIWILNSRGWVSFFLSSILISKGTRYSNSKFQIPNPLAKSRAHSLSFYILIFMENFVQAAVIRIQNKFHIWKGEWPNTYIRACSASRLKVNLQNKITLFHALIGPGSILRVLIYLRSKAKWFALQHKKDEDTTQDGDQNRLCSQPKNKRTIQH